MEFMTSLERSICSIKHQVPDRVPVIPQAHAWVMHNYGSNPRDLMHDGKRLAELQLAGLCEFGWDGVFVGTDSVALAHTLGLEVEYTDLGPTPDPQGMLKDYREAEGLTLPDPRKTRLNEWIIATRILAREVGRRTLIIARGDQGAFTLAGQLRGMENFLTDIALGENVAGVHGLLELCNRYWLMFAHLLLEAGAHVVTIGDALASGSLVSETVFDNFAFPYQKLLAAEIRRRGGIFGVHVCGETTRVMSRLVDTEADLLEFDAPTDFDAAWQAARGRTCLLGNVDTSETLVFGSPARVEEECRWRIERVKPESGFILSSGCAISPNAPRENLHAMIESARKYGAY